MMRLLFSLVSIVLPFVTAQSPSFTGSFAIGHVGTVYLDGVALQGVVDPSSTPTYRLLKVQGNATAGSILAIETLATSLGPSGFAATWFWEGIQHSTIASEWQCSSWYRPVWMLPQTNTYYMTNSVSQGVSGSSPSTAWNPSYYVPDLAATSQWLWYESSISYITPTTPPRASYCRYIFGSTPSGPAGTQPSSTSTPPARKTRTQFVGCYSNVTLFGSDHVYVGDDQIQIANWNGITSSYAVPFYRYVASIQAVELGGGFTYYFNLPPSKADLTTQCQHVCVDDNTKYCGCTQEQGDIYQCEVPQAYVVYELMSESDPAITPTTDYIDNTLTLSLGVRTTAAITLNGRDISAYPTISGFTPSTTLQNTHRMTSTATYNDVITIIVSSIGGPIGFIATWIWHQQNWMTIANEWKCTTIEQTTNDWKFPTYTDTHNIFHPLISQGVSGFNDSTSWLGASYAGDIGIASNAQWLWLEDSSNYSTTKSSIAFCRYVFPSTSTRPSTSIIPNMIQPSSNLVTSPPLLPIGSSTGGALQGSTDAPIGVPLNDATTQYTSNHLFGRIMMIVLCLLL